MKRETLVRHIDNWRLLGIRKSSKGTVKRIIIELMVVSREGDSTFEVKSKRLSLGFFYREKVGKIPNKIFPLAITTTMANFDVSRILIDGGRSCDIM